MAVSEALVIHDGLQLGVSRRMGEGIEIVVPVGTLPTRSRGRPRARSAASRSTAVPSSFARAAIPLTIGIAGNTSEPARSTAAGAGWHGKPTGPGRDRCRQGTAQLAVKYALIYCT